MQVRERALVFDCKGNQLIGIAHCPSGSSATVGIIVIVGGPQYRVGSHRQFVQLARSIAEAGYPVMRFDCRGMGDSEGNFPGFEHMDRDIRSAIDAFASSVPGLTQVVLWGLCDAASAALMYCNTDSRVCGLILANPWVRSESGEARALLRHYYLERLFQKSFWYKLIRGEVGPLRALLELLRKTRTAHGQTAPEQSFVRRMRLGMAGFAGPILTLISDRDLTAKEFLDLCAQDVEWRAAISRELIEVVPLRDADHTFSNSASLTLSTRVCIEWMSNRFGNRDSGNC